MSPYRSDEHVLAALRLEREELAAFARDARGRRRRAAAALGILFVGSLAGVVVAVPGASPRPMRRCHHVELRYEQVSGTPPPPAGWTSCG
jgi:hypothetical protein